MSHRFSPSPSDSRRAGPTAPDPDNTDADSRPTTRRPRRSRARPIAAPERRHRLGRADRACGGQRHPRLPPKRPRSRDRGVRAGCPSALRGDARCGYARAFGNTSRRSCRARIRHSASRPPHGRCASDAVMHARASACGRRSMSATTHPGKGRWLPEEVAVAMDLHFLGLPMGLPSVRRSVLSGDDRSTSRLPDRSPQHVGGRRARYLDCIGELLAWIPLPDGPLPTHFGAGMLGWGPYGGMGLSPCPRRPSSR